MLYIINDNAVYFFFQAEDGIRDLVRSRGLGDVYKRQLSAKAVSEARELMLASKNLLKPADGEPIISPSKDLSLIHI